MRISADEARLGRGAPHSGEQRGVPSTECAVGVQLVGASWSVASGKTERYPIDLLLVYLTASHHGLGQRLRLESIDKRLGGLPLRQTLRQLAIVAHLADHSLSDLDQRVELARMLIRPGRAQQRAVAMIQGGPYAAVSAQTSLILAERALLKCPDDAPPMSDTELGYRLGELLLALADHLGARSHGRRDELLLELVRLGLFYRLHGVGDWYATAFELFFDTMPSLVDDHEFVDVDALIHASIGLSLREYWSISAAIGIVAMGDRQVHIYPKQIGVVPQEQLDAWFGVQIQSIVNARDQAAHDLATGSPWALQTFFRRPIIADLTSEGGYPMRSQLLAMKATTLGLYYLVFDLLKAGGSDKHLAWSRFFGRAVEAYGKRLLRDLLPTTAAVSFPDGDREPGANQPPACDFYVDEGSAVIAGDFVHRALTLATQTTAAPKILEEELRKAVLEKVDQIEATLQERQPRSSRIFPIVVMSGPLPMTPSLDQKVDELLRQRERSFITVDTRCPRVLVLELYELRMVLLTAARNAVSVSEVLDAWQSSPLQANSFRDWLVCQARFSPGRALPGERWEELVAELFGEGSAFAEHVARAQNDSSSLLR